MMKFGRIIIFTAFQITRTLIQRSKKGNSGEQSFLRNRLLKFVQLSFKQQKIFIESCVQVQDKI